MTNKIPGATEKLFGRKNIPVNKGENGLTWSFPREQIRLGDDWYLEKYEILSRANEGSVIIDAGCKEGSWTGNIHGIIPAGVLRIGVDPIDYNVSSLRGDQTPWNSKGGDKIFDYYYKCAVDDIESQTTAAFNIFDEPGCNSLLPKSKHLNRNVLGASTVPVRSMESILLECVPANTVIHYIKCDCQGKDAAVVRSLRSFLPNTRYVQIESSFCRNNPFYDGQPYYEDDIASMRSIGFKPIFYVEYPDSPLPEGEILFERMT